MLSRNPKSEIRNPKQITSNKFQFSKPEYRVGNANLLLGETK
jgi:hypothetical protein